MLYILKSYNKILEPKWNARVLFRVCYQGRTSCFGGKSLIISQAFEKSKKIIARKFYEPTINLIVSVYFLRRSTDPIILTFLDSGSKKVKI